ncbi:hypothetical protein AcW1_005882 [Taiwanofungus camphoratus]|nr:hypothetical protein AcW1_005882 [Antrodia cinnamomea]
MNTRTGQRTCLVLSGYLSITKTIVRLFREPSHCIFLSFRDAIALLVRNVHNRRDKQIKLSDFVNRCRVASPFISSEETERLYAKDAECPRRWREWLATSNALPHAVLPNGSNDLLQYLLETEEVESLMCYFGIGDTFTPCHKDLCGSSGQNIMCYTEKDGCSFWFMTTSEIAPEVAEYFQSHLGQELDWETHVTSVEELANAPFDVYIVEQKLGDLVLVPPRSCHQVVNHGGLTMKMSWSRMTVRGLAIALHYELPIYRRVCRPEQYRVKYILYRSLLHYTTALEAALEAALSLKDFASAPRVDLPEASSMRSSKSFLVDCENSDSEGMLFPTSTLELRSARSDSPSSSATSHDEVFTSDCAKALYRLLELFDEVLCEEYVQDHASLSRIFSGESSGWSLTLSSRGKGHRSLILQPPSPSKQKLNEENEVVQSYNFACDFCGADIFQSFFECKQCVPLDTSESSTRHGDGLLICATCYVEGRSCSCERMEPVQCRPFRTLLRDRNKAADVLTRVTEGAPGRKKGQKMLNESDLSRGDHVRIFEAACALHESRQATYGQKVDRNCRTTKHRVPYLWAIYCDHCHDSKCFNHILEGGIHSAEAILAHHRDIKHDYWHQLHKETRQEFPRSKAGVQAAEKTGGSSQLRDRLVMAAQRYRQCIPINQSFTKLGWYDCQYDEVPLISEDTATDGLASISSLSKANPGVTVMQNAAESPFGSPLTEFDESSEDSVLGEVPALSLDQDVLIVPSGCTDSASSSMHGMEMQLTIPPPTKRMTIDCVLIPPMPKVHRRLKRAISQTGVKPRKRTRVSSDDDLEGTSQQPGDRISRPGLSCDHDNVHDGDYVEGLVKALSSANSERPQFHSDARDVKFSQRRLLERLPSNDSSISTAKLSVAGSSFLSAAVQPYKCRGRPPGIHHDQSDAHLIRVRRLEDGKRVDLESLPAEKIAAKTGSRSTDREADTRTLEDRLKKARKECDALQAQLHDQSLQFRTESKHIQGELKRSQHKLKQTQDELNHAQEELKRSQEELKGARGLSDSFRTKCKIIRGKSKQLAQLYHDKEKGLEDQQRKDMMQLKQSLELCKLLQDELAELKTTYKEAQTQLEENSSRLTSQAKELQQLRTAQEAARKKPGDPQALSKDEVERLIKEALERGQGSRVEDTGTNIEAYINAAVRKLGEELRNNQSSLFAQQPSAPVVVTDTSVFALLPQFQVTLTISPSLALDRRIGLQRSVATYGNGGESWNTQRSSDMERPFAAAPREWPSRGQPYRGGRGRGMPFHCQNRTYVGRNHFQRDHPTRPLQYDMQSSVPQSVPGSSMHERQTGPDHEIGVNVGQLRGPPPFNPTNTHRQNYWGHRGPHHGDHVVRPGRMTHRGPVTPPRPASLEGTEENDHHDEDSHHGEPDHSSRTSYEDAEDFNSGSRAPGSRSYIPSDWSPKQQQSPALTPESDGFWEDGYAQEDRDVGMTAQVSPTLLATDRTSPVGDLFIDNDQQDNTLSQSNHVHANATSQDCKREAQKFPSLPHLRRSNRVA